ncbi:MAG: transglycosylase SLT domain-containing protein [candidate division KSB1 bacterium]|nr:transglycosylase SLT domain-containing protein [candidate division KSB1 bacterium]
MRSIGKSWVVAIRVLAVVVGAGFVVGFTFNYRENQKRADQIEKLERAFNELRAALNVDSMRQYHVQRLMRLIEQANPTMPSDVRYEVASTIYEMSLKYTNLDVDLIAATITQETGGTWNPELVSPAGAIGLMQVMPATGQFIAYYEGITWSDPMSVLTDPVYNIRIGCRYLSSLVERYGLEGGLAAYNVGERGAAAWLAGAKSARLLPEETQRYVPAVMELYRKGKQSS